MKGTVTIKCQGCTFKHQINSPNAISSFMGNIMIGSTNLNMKRYVCTSCGGNVFKVVDIDVIA